MAIETCDQQCPPRVTLISKTKEFFRMKKNYKIDFHKWSITGTPQTIVEEWSRDYIPINDCTHMTVRGGERECPLVLVLDNTNKWIVGHDARSRKPDWPGNISAVFPASHNNTNASHWRESYAPFHGLITPVIDVRVCREPTHSARWHITQTPLRYWCYEATVFP